jgi:hypothetical protein
MLRGPERKSLEVVQGLAAALAVLAGVLAQ